MKVNQRPFQKINAVISKKAKIKLARMVLTLREDGSSDGDTTPGKLIDKLILHQEALTILKKVYSKEESFLSVNISE